LPIYVSSVDRDLVIHRIDEFLLTRYAVARGRDIAAPRGQLADTLPHFGPNLLRRDTGAIEHELAVDPSTKTDPVSKSELQCGQVMVGCWLIRS